MYYFFPKSSPRKVPNPPTPTPVRAKLPKSFGSQFFPYVDLPCAAMPPGLWKPLEPKQSKHRGVYGPTKAGKWTARIKVKGKLETIGTFIHENEAA